MAEIAEPMGISALATLTGLDRRTIGRRLKNLQPVREDRRNKSYDTATALRLIYLGGDENGEALDLTQETARYRKNQADKEALNVKRLRGELLSLDDVKAGWLDIVAAVRAKLMVLPAKLAPLVVGVDTTAEVQRIARGLIYEALAEFKDDAGTTGQPEAGSPQHVDAAAGPDGKRVGRHVSGSKQRKQRGARHLED